MASLSAMGVRLGTGLGSGAGDLGDGEAGGGLVDNALAAGERRDQGLDGEVVDLTGMPREVWWISAAASSENSVSVRPASCRWCLT